MTWLGLLIGGIIGSSWGFKSALLGALIGALIGMYLRKSAARSSESRTAAAQAGEAVSLAPSPDAAGVATGAMLPVRKGGTGGRFVQAAAEAALATASAAPAVAPLTMSAPPAAASVAMSAPAAAPSSDPDPVWAWLTGGNAMTRIGVVILFFGVAFLLRYLAEIVTVPIEWRLVGVAIIGVGLIAIGILLASARPGYGLSLQGAGAGILYLTTFAAFRLYHVLPPVPGLLLLALVAASTVALAIRADSQPLAALAVAGGFLAPILTSVTGEPALLFGYFAILNAAIFALAWVRSWRALNLLGFVFTFVLGSIWAYRYYRPLYF
ncbi:MAG TPA: DUF2339 domain-containing protein, partial [Casimicrobiaceae bacterium]|nr:DUF2339 domain-containing protein [Casimicrobiaceae bacterium]